MFIYIKEKILKRFYYFIFIPLNFFAYFIFFVSNAFIFKKFNIDAIILKDIHRIEKGLLLKNSKKNFGKAIFFRISQNCKKIKNKYLLA